MDHDFEPGTRDPLAERCRRCGATRTEVQDNVRPAKCPGRIRLRDAELDGSIARRMEEIRRAEGRA
jgi:hypothetical protein